MLVSEHPTATSHIVLLNSIATVIPAILFYISDYFFLHEYILSSPSVLNQSGKNLSVKL